MPPHKSKSLRLTKVTFTALCLLPLAWITYRLLTGDLGAQPAESFNHKTGLIGLRLLAANLVWGSVIALNRMPRRLKAYGYLRRHLGVVTFVYLTLHLIFYVLREGDPSLALRQMFTKTYLILGTLSWLILLVLSVTSADWAVRKLRARWKPLHRFVYPALVLSVIHFQLIEKKDWTEAWPYLAPVVLLWVIRLSKVARAPRPRRAT